MDQQAHCKKTASTQPVSDPGAVATGPKFNIKSQAQLTKRTTSY
jgi:hypothetical protein